MKLEVLLNANSSNQNITSNKVYIVFLIVFILIGIGALSFYIYKKIKNGKWNTNNGESKNELVEKEAEELETGIEGYTKDEIEAMLDEMNVKNNSSKINFNILDSITPNQESYPIKNEKEEPKEIEHFKEDMQEINENVMNTFIKLNDKMDRLLGKLEEMQSRLLKLEMSSSEKGVEYKQKPYEETYQSKLAKMLITRIKKMSKEALDDPIYNDIRKEVRAINE